MAYGVNLLYETNENGERVLVKSLESTQRAYLRFRNCTSRPLNLCWRDYEGAQRHYARLEPGHTFNINTFVTHPWEFTDAGTGEHFVINNKIIFRAPPCNGEMRFRMLCNITVPMRSLQQIAMLTVASLLHNKDAVNELDLPRFLKNDLEELVVKLDIATQQRTD